MLMIRNTIYDQNDVLGVIKYCTYYIISISDILMGDIHCRSSVMICLFLGYSRIFARFLFISTIVVPIIGCKIKIHIYIAINY